MSLGLKNNSYFNRGWEGSEAVLIGKYFIHAIISCVAVSGNMKFQSFIRKREKIDEFFWASGQKSDEKSSNFSMNSDREKEKQTETLCQSLRESK